MSGLGYEVTGGWDDGGFVWARAEEDLPVEDGGAVVFDSEGEQVAADDDLLLVLL